MLLEAAMAELPRSGEIRLGSHIGTTTMSLFQDDHDLVSKLLRKDASNLGTAYKSSATMQVAGRAVAHQCKEIDLEKLKNVPANDEEDYKPPISLPPIRIPSAFHHSPSSSVVQSPSLSTNKLMMNVKGPENSTNNSPNRGPLSHVSSPKERKSMLSSCYGHLQSPSAMSGASEGSFNSEDLTPSRMSNSLVGRSPMLYSPCTPSPYYFSPLSNTSSHNFHVTSPRSSIQSDTSHTPIEPITQSHVNVSVNSPNIAMLKLHDRQGALASSPHSVASFSDAEVSSPGNGGKSGGNSLSFASPEMEILDEGPTVNLNTASRGVRRAMAGFINRGRPMMHRSFSASRVTFAKDCREKPVLKKYYSAQYSGAMSQLKRANPASMQDTTSSVLDDLFPLKRPNGLKQAVNVAHNQHSSERAYVVMEELEKSSRGIGQNVVERPAQEVNITQGGDKDGFAYSPVASAFVFSPRRVSQNSYFVRSASSAGSGAQYKSNLAGGSTHGHVKVGSVEESSFSYSDEGGESVVEGTPLSTRASWGSPKISSVLLRFAEAQERLYSSAPATPHHLPSAPTCLPMCSFLGRTFSCRSKFATTAQQFQE